MIIDGKRASDRAIELILAYYAAFNRRDWKGMVSLLTDDVVHDPNQGQRATGREAFAAFLAKMERCYVEQLGNILVTATQDGTHAAAEYVVSGEYRADDEGLPQARGQRYSLNGGAFFGVRGNRIARVTNYYNLQEWMRQIDRA